MISAFVDVLLPVFLVTAVGMTLRLRLRLSASPFNQVMLYILSPALVFHFLRTIEIESASPTQIIAAVCLLTAVILLISSVVGRLLGHDRKTQSAFLLATTFPNAGNMALPMSLLAFGETGLSIAVTIFAIQSILGWVLGAFLAARSTSVGLAPLKETLRLPITWAIITALFFRASDVSLPGFIAESVGMLADAAIPMMLIILGFQLDNGVSLHRWPTIVLSVFIRLIGAGLLAYGTTIIFGLSGVVQQTFVMVAAMPTAVYTIILAKKFNAEPRLVTNIVVISTFCSLATLAPMIALVQTWL